jgi:hypothetical protein
MPPELKKTLEPPGQRAVLYANWSSLKYKVFLWKGWSINFRDGWFDWKSGVLLPFLRVESDRRATRPLPPRLFPQIHPIKTLRHLFCSKWSEGQVTKPPVSTPCIPRGRDRKLCKLFMGNILGFLLEKRVFLILGLQKRLGIKGKLWGNSKRDAEHNQNTLCVGWLRKGNISII